MSPRIDGEGLRSRKETIAGMYPKASNANLVLGYTLRARAIYQVIGSFFKRARAQEATAPKVGQTALDPEIGDDFEEQEPE